MKKTGKRKIQDVYDEEDQKDLVTINICEKKFTISRHQILAQPTTKLAKMILEEKREEKGEEEIVFNFRNLSKNSCEFFPHILRYYLDKQFPLSEVLTEQSAQQTYQQQPAQQLAQPTMNDIYDELSFWEITLTPIFETLKEASLKNFRQIKANVEKFIDKFLSKKFLEKFINNNHFDLYLQSYPHNILKLKRDYTEDDGEEYSEEDYLEYSFPLSLMVEDGEEKKRKEKEKEKEKKTKVEKTIFASVEETRVIKQIEKCAENLILESDGDELEFEYESVDKERIIANCKRVGNMHPLLVSLYELVYEQIFDEIGCVLSDSGNMLAPIMLTPLVDIIFDYLEDRDHKIIYQQVDEQILHYVLFLFDALMSGAKLFDGSVMDVYNNSSKLANQIDEILGDDNNVRERRSNDSLMNRSGTVLELKSERARKYAVDYLSSKGIAAKWIKKDIYCRCPTIPTRYKLEQMVMSEEDYEKLETFQRSRFKANGTHTFPFMICNSGVYQCLHCCENSYIGVTMNENHVGVKSSVWCLRFLW